MKNPAQVTKAVQLVRLPFRHRSIERPWRDSNPHALSGTRSFEADRLYAPVVGCGVFFASTFLLSIAVTGRGGRKRKGSWDSEKIERTLMPPVDHPTTTLL